MLGGMAEEIKRSETDDDGGLPSVLTLSPAKSFIVVTFLSQVNRTPPTMRFPKSSTPTIHTQSSSSSQFPGGIIKELK